MSRGTAPDAPLRELARAHGVSTEYVTDRGRRVTVAADTLVAVLASCGVDASTPAAARRALTARAAADADRLLPACVVSRAGSAVELRLPSDAEARVRLEGGGVCALSTPLPPGAHVLHASAGRRRASAPLLSVPDRVPVPGRRGWGFLVQLYSVLSHRSWGMGDLADLAELAAWSGHELGADFVQLGPLHAVEPGPLPDPSPYRPSSRRFADPMHVRVEEVPEYRYLDREARRAVDSCAARARDLNERVLRGETLIDREAVRDLKQEALRRLYAVPPAPGRRAALEAFVAREGEDLTEFATWCALAEVHGGAWRSWPEGLRDPRSPAVAEAREELADAVAFHRWSAWITDEQLASAQRAATGAGMAIGLVHDLAVGVAPEGADAWALQHCLAGRMSVGAPPDDFNPLGQDWGQPPWRPDALAAEGYRPLAALLRAGMRHAGALRVDHVMGLFRLWWVPEGRPPSEGTYVRYDAEAMLGVLLLEAHRAGVAVIGEDLGTVESGVREELAARGVLGTSVQRFEYLGGSEGRDGPLPADRWRTHCLATLTTHDLPTTAAWLSGEHVDLRARLGLLTRPEPEEKAQAAAERDAWLAELRRSDLLPDADGEVVALHRFLTRTPSTLLGVWLPDATGDRRPQNLPGTADVHPNWRLPIADRHGRPVALEELPAHPDVQAIARVFDDSEPHGTKTEETDVRPGSCPS
ncbi:4-alpha-glucanotransferase [Streptomyces sp. 3330]|uniref:4-alpha-glucanotransferase n=1 Tax=Streptomyces sp. 3330 TaxID=2817755 RepID=UPI00285BAA92|nr:4-alpha-glucanotransferase [Streptomyces sp. 3330]MDR6978444.1 4-alpha-glucanotransferase [Streptomyces sp. 3330]